MQICGEVGKNTLFAAGQNFASNTGIFGIAQNDHEPSKISDSVASNRENVCSEEDMDEVSGPSDENNLNLSFDMLQPLYEAEKGKVLTCKVCKAEISKHKRLQGEKNFYECCICNYNNADEDKFHEHSFTHITYKFCNICLKGHTEGDSHDGQKTCTLCQEKCDCTTGLKEHLLVHEELFETLCWGCFINLDDHRTKVRRTLYVCCLCPFKSHDITHWKSHNKTHRPKLFCKVCSEEYPAAEKDSHQGEYMCIVCKVNFKCKGVFQKDSIDHFLNDLCILCNKKIFHHGITNNQSNIFQCCICRQEFRLKMDFKIHLYRHACLKVFKCVMCGKRFSKKRSLERHKQSCQAVPYTCEICGARFPRNDILDRHRSVKHALV